MNILKASRDKTVFSETGSRAIKEVPVFTISMATLVALNVILLIIFGGWWIFFFPIALLPHLLFMFSSFYIRLSKLTGTIRKLFLVLAIYGVIFPLVYLPAVLDNTDYSYILFGIRPSPDSWISQLIQSSSVYAWWFLAVSASLIFFVVLYISITKRRNLKNIKSIDKTDK